MYSDPFKHDEKLDAGAQFPCGMVVEMQVETQRIEIAIYADGQQRAFSHEINLLAETVPLKNAGPRTFLEISDQITKYYTEDQTVALVADHQLAIGRALFDAVFKPLDEEALNWMEQFDGGLDTARGPLDLLIRSSSPDITNLPWPLLNFRNRFCFERLWQIALDYRPDTSKHAKILFPDRPRVLLACPEPQGLQHTDWQTHVDMLKETLKPDGNALKEISFLDCGGRWSDVREALRSQEYDVLYYYGHGARTEHGGAVLQFEDETGQPMNVPPADLRLAISDGPSRPLLAYINCCNGAGDDLSNFGAGLIRAAPAVVSNRTVALQSAARQQALDFLSAVTLGRCSPQVAYARMLRDLVPSNLTTMDLRWMTPVLYRAFDDWVPAGSGRSSDWNIVEWQSFLNRDEEVSAFKTGMKTLSDEVDPSDALVHFAIGDEGDGLPHLLQRLQQETQRKGDNEIAVSRVRTYHVSWPSEDSGDFDHSAIENMLRMSIGQVSGHSITESINTQIMSMGGTPDKPAAMLLKFNLSQFAQPSSVQLFLKWMDMEAGSLFAGPCKGLLCFSVDCASREQQKLKQDYQALLYQTEPEDARGFLGRLFFRRTEEKAERPSKFVSVHIAGVFVLERVLTQHVSDFVRRFHKSYSRASKSSNLPEFVADFIEHVVKETDGRHDRILTSLKDFNGQVLRFQARKDRDIP